MLPQNLKVLRHLPVVIKDQEPEEEPQHQPSHPHGSRTTSMLREAMQPNRNRKEKLNRNQRLNRNHSQRAVQSQSRKTQEQNRKAVHQSQNQKEEQSWKDMEPSSRVISPRVTVDFKLHKDSLMTLPPGEDLEVKYMTPTCTSTWDKGTVREGEEWIPPCIPEC